MPDRHAGVHSWRKERPPFGLSPARRLTEGWCRNVHPAPKHLAHALVAKRNSALLVRRRRASSWSRTLTSLLSDGDRRASNRSCTAVQTLLACWPRARTCARRLLNVAFADGNG